MAEILVLYYSHNGSVAQMARLLARGIESVPDCQARLRSVPPVATGWAEACDPIPAQGDPYATLADLQECAGVAVGSPSYFGNMAAPLKHFFDSTSSLWLAGTLVGKPAAVFASSGSMHGGQETVLVSMMLPLLHHGMVIVGIPYTDAALTRTTAGGTPYGATHVAGMRDDSPITEDERSLCLAQGRRLAETAMRLSQ